MKCRDKFMWKQEVEWEGGIYCFNKEVKKFRVQEVG